MKTLLGWLFGTVTAKVTGAQPEDFLNLCARENLILWRMLQQDRFTLEIQVTARQFPRLAELARRAGFEVTGGAPPGLPFSCCALPAVRPAGGGGGLPGTLQRGGRGRCSPSTSPATRA